MIRAPSSVGETFAKPFAPAPRDPSDLSLDALLAEFVLFSARPLGLAADDAPPLARAVGDVVERLAEPQDGRRSAPRGVWLTGPRGSGKSTLLRLLGAALTAARLEDGRAVSEALELERAFRASGSLPVAMMGGRDARESPLSAHALRAVARELGYSADPFIAEGERALERADLFHGFSEMFARSNAAPWGDLKDRPDAARLFTAAVGALGHPRAPHSLLDRARRSAAEAPTAREVADALGAMVTARHPKARFLVLIVDDADALDQAEFAALSAQLLLRGRGRIAVFAASQGAPGEPGSTLDSCFPAARRLHIAPALHRALAARAVLSKSESGKASVGDLVRAAAHERDRPAIEALYPIHPGVFDRVVEISAALLRRSRGSSSPPAGPLAIAHALAAGASSAPFGALVPLDCAFDLVAGQLDADARRAVEGARALGSDLAAMPLAARAARAIALLELLQPDTSTTFELLGEVLRDHVSAAVDTDELHEAVLELLHRGVIFRSPRDGYGLVTPTYEAWTAERAAFQITGEEVSQIIRDELALLLDAVSLPPTANGPLRFRALYADGRRAHDEPILDRGEGFCFTLDARHLPLYRRTKEEWFGRSARGNLVNRLVWIAEGDIESILAVGFELARSRRQLRRAMPVLGRATGQLARLVDFETARQGELNASMTAAVERTFLEGAFYFRGELLRARSLGDRFASALVGAASAVLPRLMGAAEAEALPVSGADEVVVSLPRGREVRDLAALDALLEEIGRAVRVPLERGAKKVRID